ncbi:MAG: DUF2442 domain-containing protein [Candidatus Cloacimonadota bacterium]|nr:DUF2442 domain-containing protein [Candidatus Cloacimonadota bacterium]
MNSLMNGMRISSIEITNISSHGFWIFAHNQEFFLSYESFPWFKDKTIRNISNVIEESPRHLYWPDLDIDLSYDSIINPNKYPLIYKNASI